jgi:membrane protein required for colicin V production
MNSFDAVVCLLVVVAAVTGFNNGLLRSLATILGYVCAMPVAVAVASKLPVPAGAPAMPWGEKPAVVFGLFLAMGVLFGTLLRSALRETVGPSVRIADRLAGAMLGAVRIFLVAVTMVLIFDRLIPADRQPAFLSESHLRPILSIAAKRGLKSLPPDVADYLDQLKIDSRLDAP